MNKVVALAVITFKEGVRTRSLFGIFLFALFVFGLNIAVAGFFMRDISKVSVDMNLAAREVSGLLLTLFVGLNLLAKDIDKKTIHLVLAYPISRLQYVLGKYLGVLGLILVCLAVIAGVSSLTIGCLQGIYANYFTAFSWGNLLLAFVFIFFKFVVLASLMFFFSSLTTSSFIALIFSLSAYVVGTTIEDVIFYIRSGVAEEAISPGLSHFLDVVTYLFPNFNIFNLQVEAAHGLPIAPAHLLTASGYGLAYSALMLLFSVLVFSRREFF